jgi:hypothetical protein
MVKFKGVQPQSPMVVRRLYSGIIAQTAVPVIDPIRAAAESCLRIHDALRRSALELEYRVVSALL